MAKGRKHGSSDRQERLLGTYGFDQRHVASTGQPDFDEDDVWMTSTPDDASNESWKSSSPDRINPDRTSRTRRWLTRGDHRHVGGLSLAFEDGNTAGPTVLHQYRNVDSPSNRHAVAASVPVNVPDWSRMVRVDSADSLHGSGEMDQDEEGEWVPPHEYLAREHARTVTTSVFEGVGRTLKGRDMSRVRDAVWSRTGFFG